MPTPAPRPPALRLAALAMLVALLPLAAQEATPALGFVAPPPPYPFAMCSNPGIINNPAYAEKMLDAGARLCRADFTFGGVRPKPGDDPATWNWASLEKLRAVRAKHPDLQFLVLLGYGALWAEDEKFRDPKPLPEGARPPFNGPQAGASILPPDDPRNLYGHYVYEVVKRYRDVVSCWESWNEPDLPGHHYFRGSGKDFFAYQKACYLAAKKADPKCTVLFAGMCYASIEGYLAAHQLKVPSPYPPKTSFFEEYLQECVKDPDARANGFYFDVMNQHSYSRASDVYDYVVINHKLMQDYLGVVKPTWVTEMGIVDAEKPNGFGCTPTEYCDYLLQSFAWGRLAGVERFFHFQLDNSNQHGLYRGMLGEAKPALTTYRDVLVKEFAEARLVKQLHGTRGVDFLAGNSAFAPTWKAGYDLFEFASRDGKRRLLLAFADTDKAVEVKVPATRAKATLVTRDNQRKELAAVDGAYALTLPGATNVGGWPSFKDNPTAVAMGQPEHRIGGATLVLIEE